MGRWIEHNGTVPSGTALEVEDTGLEPVTFRLPVAKCTAEHKSFQTVFLDAF
jgi:hypothetical protein